VKNNQVHHIPDTLFEQNLAVELGSVLNNRKLNLQVKESTDLVPFVALKVYMFPQINLVWLGVVIMMSGFVISLLQRQRTLRKYGSQGSPTLGKRRKLY